MGKILKFIKNIQFVFRPTYWLMNYSYSKEWDKELNTLMDEHFFTDFQNCTAKLGDTKIWVENHPYASFTKFTLENGYHYRPSRLTLLRAKRHLKFSIQNQRYITLRNQLSNSFNETIELLNNLKESKYKNEKSFMHNKPIKKLKL